MKTAPQSQRDDPCSLSTPMDCILSGWSPWEWLTGEPEAWRQLPSPSARPPLTVGGHMNKQEGEDSWPWLWAWCVFQIAGPIGLHFMKRQLRDAYWPWKLWLHRWVNERLDPWCLCYNQASFLISFDCSRGLAGPIWVPAQPFYADASSPNSLFVPRASPSLGSWLVFCPIPTFPFWVSLCFIKSFPMRLTGDALKPVLH